MSGIYRDVYLVGFPLESRIEDLFVQTKLDSQYVHAQLRVRVSVAGKGDVKVTLLDPAMSDTIVASSASAQSSGPVEFSLAVEAPQKWTAETPTLYHLVVSLDETSYISHRVGFRQVEMKDGLIQVNGKRIVLRGANRHEHHPTFGRSVPLEFLKQDLMLMKTHNINAIRTSHQPSDPRLYDLADELGVSTSAPSGPGLHADWLTRSFGSWTRPIWNVTGSKPSVRCVMAQPRMPS